MIFSPKHFCIAAISKTFKWILRKKSLEFCPGTIAEVAKASGKLVQMTLNSKTPNSYCCLQVIDKATSVMVLGIFIKNHIPNKCQPILVQGLRRDIELNFHIINIYGSVAQWIKCLAWELKDPDSIPSQGDFFSLKFLLKRK